MGAVKQRMGNESIPLMQPSSFLLSTPTSATTTQPPLFPDISGTFACECTPNVPRRVQYIVSVIDSSDGPTCMDKELLQYTCGELKRLGMMVCDSAWSSGVSGLAEDASVRSGVLTETARRICRRQRGTCIDRTQFLGVRDQVLPP